MFGNKNKDENKAASTKTVEATKTTETTTTTTPAAKEITTQKEEIKTAAKTSTDVAPKAKEGKADKVADIFKRNPLQKQMFQTSDGFYFIDKPLAKRHAATLTNKKVTVITKNQPLADESDD